ncbi:amidase domain-containing protein [Bacillus carboniphilus]|uniref:Amidase domain-containing protein n=1 Tax=Bacillus carboniphilus TaxID=86663 RepID=A0ABN0WRK2_9BACI
MNDLLQDLLQNRLECYVNHKSKPQRFFVEEIERKNLAEQNRKAEIVKVNGKGKILDVFEEEDVEKVRYQLLMRYVIKQKGQIFIEESIEDRLAEVFRSTIVDDYLLQPEGVTEDETIEVFNQNDMDLYPFNNDAEERISYQYDRRKAVRYAETWWNSYNPKYKKFENDCTNFISQCLHEGGGPMRGYPNRGKGWWMRNSNWSYSWSVAHSLRLYLGNSTIGVRARQVSSPEELLLGDVICYDFEGDGRYNHNTIVTAKDANGMPLVNAHTYNSRARYWAYEDSTAYTPNIKYKFFTIVDG